MDKQELKAFCRQLGLTEVGVAPSRLPVPDPLPEICPLAAGKGLERYDLTRLLPGCQGAVVVLFPYWQPPVSGSNLSLYCQLPDYHPVVRKYLEQIAGWMAARNPDSGQLAIVDTSPLAERDLAVQAGVGFLGGQWLPDQSHLRLLVLHRGRAHHLAPGTGPASGTELLPLRSLCPELSGPLLPGGNLWVPDLQILPDPEKRGTDGRGTGHSPENASDIRL